MNELVTVHRAMNQPTSYKKLHVVIRGLAPLRHAPVSRVLNWLQQAAQDTKAAFIIYKAVRQAICNDRNMRKQKNLPVINEEGRVEINIGAGNLNIKRSSPRGRAGMDVIWKHRANVIVRIINGGENGTSSISNVD